MILSVICPVTQMAGKLQRLENWIPKALLHDIEVIIVHDNQDFATESELQDLITRNSWDRVILISKKINSPGLARNLGLKVASGEWVSFWDSDDVPNVENALQMVREATIQASSICMGRFSIINDESIFGTTLAEVVNMPGLWRFSFRKEAIQSVNFSQFKWGEDQLFLSRAIRNFPEVYKSSLNVYSYDNDFEGQLTKSRVQVRDLQCVQLEMLRDKKMQRRGDETSLRNLLIARQVLTITKYLNRRKRIFYLIKMGRIILQEEPKIALNILSVLLYRNRFAGPKYEK
jgi:glycosyltransferase involved in cell wall biosynthesis